MDSILSCCSRSLVVRLAGTDNPHLAPRLALARIREEVRKLPPTSRQILSWHFGLEGHPVGLTTAADRLALPREQVEPLLDQALAELGFALVMAAPAAPSSAETAAASEPPMAA